MPVDRSLIVDQLHADLRAVLLAKFYQVPMDIMAALLAYELTSILATKAGNQLQAVEAITLFKNVMCEQVRTHGVGRAHPVFTGGVTVGD